MVKSIFDVARSMMKGGVEGIAYPIGDEIRVKQYRKEKNAS